MFRFSRPRKKKDGRSKECEHDFPSRQPARLNIKMICYYNTLTGIRSQDDALVDTFGSARPIWTDIFQAEIPGLSSLKLKKK